MGRFTIVEPAVGGSGAVEAEDQKSSKGHRAIKASVEAEHELVEIGPKMGFGDAVEGAVQPGFEGASTVVIKTAMDSTLLRLPGLSKPSASACRPLTVVRSDQACCALAATFARMPAHHYLAGDDRQADSDICRMAVGRVGFLSTVDHPLAGFPHIA